MSRFSDTVRDDLGRAIPDVLVYVYEWDVPSGQTGALSALTDDDLTTALPNPLTTDEFGQFYFNSTNGVKLIEYHYAGKLLSRDQIILTPAGFYPGNDATIRADLAALGGGNLVDYHAADVGALARTVQAKLREGRYSTGDYTVLPTVTTPDGWHWDYTNPDGAGTARLTGSVPNTVNMSGGANVQGAGLIFTGSTSAQTPNSGLAETNMIRMAYTVNSDAGQKLQCHLINGTLICAHDIGASGNEGAFILGTMRATGPVAGGSNVAIGCWGGDLHVEKASGVADGEMVGLEVGMTKAPALGSAKNIGVDIYSDDRSGITATRAGTGLRIRGGRGWTNYFEMTHTDGVTDVCKLDQNGNFTITAPSGDQVILFQTNQNNTTSTNEVIGRTAGGVNVQAVMQADKGGQVLLGAATNHPLVLVVNNAEVGRWTASALNLASGKVIQVNGTQVVAARDTGWAADTGTARKATNATYAAGATLTFSASYVQAEHTAVGTRLAAIETALQNASQTQKATKDALIAHGLIGA
jgi:hypothetical protein